MGKGRGGMIAPKANILNLLRYQFDFMRHTFTNQRSNLAKISRNYFDVTIRSLYNQMCLTNRLKVKKYAIWKLYNNCWPPSHGECDFWKAVVTFVCICPQLFKDQAWSLIGRFGGFWQLFRKPDDLIAQKSSWREAIGSGQPFLPFFRPIRINWWSHIVLYFTWLVRKGSINGHSFSVLFHTWSEPKVD